MKRTVYQFVMVVAIMLACHGQAFSNVVENNEVVATSDSDADGYIYTPLVKDGVMWKYVHSGMNYDHTEPYVFETYCYISGTVEVDGKLYHKCFVENPNLDDVCVAYLREEDKRVYMMSVWEEKDREIYFYQTGGKEELIYDFNLNVGDTYVSNGANLEVKDVKYEEMDGVLRKVYEVYGEKHFDGSYMESHTYTIVEGIGATANRCGLFCFPYIDDYLGGAYPMYDQQIVDSYTPLLKEDKAWKYEHVVNGYDFTCLYSYYSHCYISGTVEVDGKLYHKCFVDNLNLHDVCVAYLREEDKRVYMMSVWEEKDREIYFYQTDGKEELIYDFNLNVGDTYISNNTNLEVKSVKRECVDGTLRKTYDVYGEKHFDSGYMESPTYTIVEGVGVTGSFDGLFCFPYVEDFVGEPYPEFEEVVLNYSAGVEELFDTDAAGSLTLAQGSGVVSVGGAVGEVTAAIYALDGVVRVQASAEGSVSLSVAELPVGIYVIKAVDGAGRRLAKKIVVR